MKIDPTVQNKKGAPAHEAQSPNLQQCNPAQVQINIGTGAAPPLDGPETKRSNYTQNIEKAQWFQLVGESIVCLGSSLFLLDAIQQSNYVYAAGSVCCQLGSVLMIAQSILVIVSSKRQKRP